MEAGRAGEIPSVIMELRRFTTPEETSPVDGRRRRSRSSRRSHDLPRRTGKPSAGPRRPGDRTSQSREVCVMQNAETVLDVLREITGEPPSAHRVPSWGRPVARLSPIGHHGRLARRADNALVSAKSDVAKPWPASASSCFRRHLPHSGSALRSAPNLHPT